LLNGENVWDKDISCDKVEGPCELIRKEVILKVLMSVEKGRKAGYVGVSSELMTVDENLGMELLTDLFSLIVVVGKMPDDWQYSVLLPVFKQKGDPM